MPQRGAPLGGVFAGHIVVKDSWFGFDDGLYAAARVLEILSQLRHSAHEEFASFPSSVNTPEIKVPVPEADRFELMQRIIDNADFPGAKLVLLDGLRVEFSDGWGLVRASNTSAALSLRFEADTLLRLQAIQTSFKALIHSADKGLELNF